ncbi:MAG: hypothetical protein KDA58_09980 [Planctomycetaceae bacterium]|nr:hypothetical protein [Planctomycetaceae bacterium]
MTLSSSVAGEDLRCGDYVTPLTHIVEAPSYLWDDCGTTAPGEMVPVTLTPEDAGLPLKVFELCLPFIYAHTPRGEVRILNLRQMRLVRLHRRTGKAVWKELRKQRVADWR